VQELLLAMVAVDLGGRSNEHALAEPGAVLEDVLRSLDVCQHRADRLIYDEAHPDRRRQVVDDVALVDELADHGRRENGLDD
jgi:hypothetical protein